MKSVQCSLLYAYIVRKPTIQSEKLSKTKKWSNTILKKEEVLVQIGSIDESYWNQGRKCSIICGQLFNPLYYLIDKMYEVWYYQYLGTNS